MQHAYIGLGSNLEDPLTQVTQAFTELAVIPHSHLVSHSPLYRSAAVGHGEQPDYINAVALLTTELSPIELLDALQAIEQAHRRVRIEHWGPRTLDLDILLFGDQQISNARLTIPHPFLTQRNFVLYPLADISPRLQLPNGESIVDMITRINRDGLERLE